MQRIAPPGQEGWLRRRRRRGGCSDESFEQPPRRFAPPLLDRRGNDNMTSAFFNPHHELRSGWKFAVFVLILLPVWVAMSLALSLIFAATIGLEDQLHLLALNSLASLIAALVATVFVARVIEHVPLQVLGIGF